MNKKPNCWLGKAKRSVLMLIRTSRQTLLNVTHLYCHPHCTNLLATSIRQEDVEREHEHKGPRPRHCYGRLTPQTGDGEYSFQILAERLEMDGICQLSAFENIDWEQSYGFLKIPKSATGDRTQYVESSSGPITIVATTLHCTTLNSRSKVICDPMLDQLIGCFLKKNSQTEKFRNSKQITTVRR